ncbi:MAG: hypothetical protein AAFW46_07015 [Pseudomonadota bacterium]
MVGGDLRSALAAAEAAVAAGRVPAGDAAEAERTPVENDASESAERAGVLALDDLLATLEREGLVEDIGCAETRGAAAPQFVVSVKDAPAAEAEADQAEADDPIAPVAADPAAGSVTGSLLAPDDAAAPRVPTCAFDPIDALLGAIDAAEAAQSGVLCASAADRLGLVFDAQRSDLLRAIARQAACLPEDVAITAIDWYMDALLGDASANA